MQILIIVFHRHFLLRAETTFRITALTLALQAEDASGFVTVTGAGEAGDVKLIKQGRGDAATFQWQQLESGDFMLLSLVTHRCIAIDSSANGLLHAQSRGASPNRTNGASFTWADGASTP